MGGELTDPAVMVARSRQHAAAAETLAAAGNEWFAVCWFYGAYHLARARMHADPIFQDPTRLTQVSPRLCMDDRTASRHQGRKGAKGQPELGVSDIVRLLYPEIVGSYHRLHQASIDVRYGRGLSATPDDLRPRHDQIYTWYQGASTS